MQIFYINQNSTLPVLRMELINDGIYEFLKSHTYGDAIQNADVTFTMYDEQGRLKISKSPCRILPSLETTCEDKYIIEYDWKPRDTKEKGVYRGVFEIIFNNDIYEDGTNFPNGNLIMPIHEDLEIMIK